MDTRATGVINLPNSSSSPTENNTLITEINQEYRYQQPQNHRWLRITLIVVLLGSLAFVIFDSLTNKHIKDVSIHFIEWVQRNPRLGVIAVIVVYILATILFIPGSILTIGAGFAFGSAFDDTAKGVALASTSVFIGAVIGSMCSFLLGRYLFRKCVIQLASHYVIFQAIDKALENNGLKIMILLRLSPLVPYNALDYLSGLTSIPFWAYSLALLAILPGTIVFCFIGATASSITSSGEHEKVRLVTLILGVIFALVGIILASYYSKQELDKILKEDQEESPIDNITSDREP